MKKFVLSVALMAAMATGCTDDDKKDKDGDSVSVPPSERVIPSNFANDRDEAGFKQKLPETSAVMQDSTSNLSLKGKSGMPTKKAQGNLTRGLAMALANEIGIPVGAKKSLAKVKNVSFFGEDADVDWSEDDLSEGQDMYEQIGDLEVGDDCTMLLNDLSGQYDQALKSYTEVVNQIAATDFAKEEGFSVDTDKDPTKEAFAYKFFLEPDTSEFGAEDGKANISGRFAGGANDDAVAFTLNGVLAFQATDGSGNIGLDLNNYADIPAKQLSFGVGVGMDVAGKDEEGNDVRGQGAINIKTSLQGGTMPGQTLALKGEFNDGAQASSGEINMALKRVSSDVMTLDVNASTSEGENFAQKVTMGITKSEFNYETCKVTAIDD